MSDEYPQEVADAIIADRVGSPKSKVRTFESGANRSSEEGKLDYEGALSPLVLERYAQYLHEHRTLSDGTTRDSDNWQKGMPLSAYMKSAWRHFMEVWKIHRGWWYKFISEGRQKALETALCGVLFNIMGYLHESLKAEFEANAMEEGLYEKGLKAIARDLHKTRLR